MCCDVKRRVACRLKNKDLENDPYTCRQLGCCYDTGRRQKPNRRPGYYGRRRRKRGKYGRRPGRYGDEPGTYGRPRYRYGHYGDETTYGSTTQPRCFKTRHSKQLYSTLSHPYSLGTCESTVCVRIEYRIESGAKIRILRFEFESNLRIEPFQLQRMLIIKIGNYK